MTKIPKYFLSYQVLGHSSSVGLDNLNYQFINQFSDCPNFLLSSSSSTFELRRSSVINRNNNRRRGNSATWAVYSSSSSEYFDSFPKAFQAFKDKCQNVNFNQLVLNLGV